MKLSEWLTQVVDRRLALGSISEGSVSLYKAAHKRLPAKLLKMGVAEIKRRDIEEAVADMNTRGLSPATIKHALTILASAFNEAIDNELIQGNPAVRIKTPKKKTRLNRNVATDGLKRLMSIAENHPYGWLLRFALGTGLRRGELLALTWGDLDLKAGTVNVNKSVIVIDNKEYISTPKTASSNRIVTLPPAIIAEATRRRGNYDDNNHVFISSQKCRLALSTASDRIKEMLVAAGLPDQTLHSLRHTHASQLVSLGLPLPAIAQRMGHANVATTMSVYAHPTAGEDAKLAAAFGAAN